MSRYVVLEHSYRGVHWDLMLQWGQVLRTWALAEPPRADAAIAAEQLSDHRTAYLDYEGPVSGDRGQVQRWDQGEYQLLQDQEDCVIVQLEGRRLRGRATLQRRSSPDPWHFFLERIADADR